MKQPSDMRVSWWNPGNDVVVIDKAVEVPSIVLTHKSRETTFPDGWLAVCINGGNRNNSQPLGSGDCSQRSAQAVTCQHNCTTGELLEFLFDLRSHDRKTGVEATMHGPVRLTGAESIEVGQPVTNTFRTAKCDQDRVR